MNLILLMKRRVKKMKKFLQKRVDNHNSLFLKGLNGISLKYNEQDSLEKNPEGT